LCRCDPISDCGDITPVDDVRGQFELIESMSSEIRDLTVRLKARVKPEEFRLVWALRDAVERLAIAEEMARERQLIDGLAQHLPDAADTIEALGWHTLGEELAVDGPI